MVRDQTIGLTVITHGAETGMAEVVVVGRVERVAEGGMVMIGIVMKEVVVIEIREIRAEVREIMMIIARKKIELEITIIVVENIMITAVVAVAMAMAMVMVMGVVVDEYKRLEPLILNDPNLPLTQVGIHS